MRNLPATSSGRPLVSVVVPAFNEAGNLALLFTQLAKVLGELVADDWELIIVDDGSADATWETIGSLAAQSPLVKGVRLSRNFGHQYALMAGLENATGQAVITMDADLQHPVTLIPAMLEKWRAGHLVVKTMREDPPDLGRFKRWTSHGFYRLFSWLSGVRMQPGLADFRLMDRSALAQLLRFKEEGLFLRGLTEWVGFPSCVLAYRAGQRHAGRSQYNLRKMIRLAWHGVSSFSILPLRIGILTGLMGSVISFCGVFYAVFGKLFGKETVPGWASTLLVISLLFSLLFIYLGILGEYVGRIIIEVRQRPRFIVCDRTGFGDCDPDACETVPPPPRNADPQG